MTDNRTLGDMVNNPADLRSYLPNEVFVLPDCYVGVELEVEGCNLPGDAANRLPFWSIKDDGSLRGLGSYEFVLTYPLCGEDLHQALLSLAEVMAEAGPRLSFRCSTHVHLDVRNMTAEEAHRLIATYSSVEPLLFAYAGEGRENNAYCTPFNSASNSRMRLGSASQGLEMFKDRGLVKGFGQWNKYTALNVLVSTEFGSFEFRHLEARITYNELVEWINIIMCLKKFAMTSSLETQAMPMFMSNLGPHGFVEAIFGRYADVLLRAAGTDIVRTLYKSVRASQDFLNATKLELASIRVRHYVTAESGLVDDSLNPMLVSLGASDSSIVKHHSNSNWTASPVAPRYLVNDEEELKLQLNYGT